MGSILHTDRFYRPSTRRIVSDDEAFDAVAALADRLVAEGGQPCRIAIARSGLLGISIPDELGGADLTNTTLVDVVRRLAVAAPLAAQRLTSHYIASEMIRHAEGLSRAVFQQVLDGAMLAAAFEDADGTLLPVGGLMVRECGVEPAMWTVTLRNPVSGAASIRLTKAEGFAVEPSEPETDPAEWFVGAATQLDAAVLPMIAAIASLLRAGIFLGELENRQSAQVCPAAAGVSPRIVAIETMKALAERLGHAIDRAQVEPTAANIDGAARLAGVLESMHLHFVDALAGASDH